MTVFHARLIGLALSLVCVVAEQYCAASLQDYSFVNELENLGASVTLERIGGTFAPRRIAFNGRNLKPRKEKILAAMAKVERLSELHFINCIVDDELLKIVERMRDLEQLKMSFTKMTSDQFKIIGTLSSLKVLDLKSTGIDTLDYVADNRDLRELDLSFNRLKDDGFRSITKFQKLERLYILSSRITDKSLELVLGLKELRELNLGFSKITSHDLQKLTALPNLHSLNLAGTELNDEGMAILAKMVGLKKLDVNGTNVTREGVERARKERPKLEIDYLVGD
jgi:Leucine-rich repeat (LRR) protein